MRSLTDFADVRSPEDLSRRQRLLIGYVFGLVCVVLFYTIVYNTGMRTLEGDSHSLFRSFQTVVETMTTTGYGADSPWTTPWMNALVVTMQLSGIAIGFFTLRVLVIPLFERTSLDLDDRLTSKDDHVVIGEYRRDSGVLLDELERLGIDYVLIDSEEEEAKRLSDDGYQAINGDPETVETLERASIHEADLLVTDAGDRNASIALSALDLNADLRVASLTESTRRNAALERIGVDSVISPHVLIGRRLAHKATTSVSFPEGTALGEDVEIREVLVRRRSPLRGTAVRDTPFFDHPNLTLVAGWFDGDLRLPPDPTDRLMPNTVLLLAGPKGAIDDVSEKLSGTGLRTTRDHTSVVVAGAGEGGRAVVETLPEDVSTTTVDVEDHDGVDLVGDVGDPETLTEAGLDEATALVVTVDDDATALLTVALARSLNEDIEILARVTDEDKVRTAFSGGADYVLSIQQATARLLAREVYGEDVISPVSQIRMIRTDAAPLAGRSIDEVNAGSETGWVIVGVERDGEYLTDEKTAIRDTDRLLVAGTDAMIREFEDGTALS
ncbi:calcium-gated potassium channel MthK [Halalkalicoccus paucihalophilus]|uniref:Calcium-gated potassium channel MthK n=1 Tax=Halalkalicoccus paucihalophilus TaxID=1008153 RepID=A0A151AEH2_9EURY|nr:NAD-binding protein [Halalkalicoccus paucihalophilus]KYH26023.1 calcium-gated potassium channel MthK [Halalkalicoccus paucihalophilus]